MGFNIDNTTAAGSTGGSFSDNIFEVYAFGDTTKKVKFQVLGNTGTTTTIQTNSSVSQTIAFRDAPGGDFFVFENLAQNVLNKTLDNTNVVTLRDDRFTLQDNVDPTKQLLFQLSGITAATTRTITIPDASGILVLEAFAQALSNKTIGVTNTVTLLDTLFTLQDNVDPTKQLLFQLSGITAATTRTLTIPDASGILVLEAFAQNLTNKTLDNSNVVTLRDDRFTLQDNVDPTKQAVFQLSGITAATTRTYTLRDESGTLQMQRLTTKGDILAYSTTDARFPVSGNNGYVLTEDSTQAFGFKWAQALALQVEQVQMFGFAGNGSTATKIPYFNTTTVNTGSAIFTLANSSVNGCSITFLKDAVVYAGYSSYGIAGDQLGVSLDGVVTTNLYSLSNIQRKCFAQPMNTTIGYAGLASSGFVVSAGQVVRPHTNGNTPGDPNSCQFNLLAIALS